MAGLTRRELIKHRHGRSGVRVPPPSPPERLHSLTVTSSLVSIAWRRSHDHGRKVHYQVLRNGRHLAHVHAPRFDDHGVSPGRAYRYAVRTIDGDRESRRSRILFITTPAAVTSATLVPAPSAPPPWLSATTQAVLLALAASAPATRASQRLERQYALRSLMLGGPDGQVM
jgi:hypothetical protein